VEIFRRKTFDRLLHPGNIDTHALGEPTFAAAIGGEKKVSFTPSPTPIPIPTRISVAIAITGCARMTVPSVASGPGLASGIACVLWTNVLVEPWIPH
jgi:hypothetical protein